MLNLDNFQTEFCCKGREEVLPSIERHQTVFAEQCYDSGVNARLSGVLHTTSLKIEKILSILRTPLVPFSKTSHTGVAPLSVLQGRRQCLLILVTLRSHPFRLALVLRVCTLQCLNLYSLLWFIWPLLPKLCYPKTLVVCYSLLSAPLVLQLSFTFLVYPCLLIAYIGQAAFIIKHPDLVSVTFYKSIPSQQSLSLILCTNSPTKQTKL